MKLSNPFAWFSSHRDLLPLGARGPLRVMFVITSMPVGGMETLLVNLVRRMDRTRFWPELCCLKEPGPLGEVLAREIPTFSHLIGHKYDVRVLGRLARLMREREIDAVVTVGTGGDKMFWGRLAAWRAGVPVVLSAIHSTGLPDRVEFSNRFLAPWTDGFIGVAEAHGHYLSEHEGCPSNKVFVIPNGVDVERFRPLAPDSTLRSSLKLPLRATIATIVAALRPEKNHELFLRSMGRVRERLPDARFLIVGDGPRREELQALAHQLGLDEAVQFLGTRSDVPELLALSTVFVLSSHMEANPVSILEAMACGKPVVAPRVGSIPESVHDGQNGYLFTAGEEDELTLAVTRLLSNPHLAEQLGLEGRQRVVERCSLERMVEGYQSLIREIYTAKTEAQAGSSSKKPSSKAKTDSSTVEVELAKVFTE